MCKGPGMEKVNELTDCEEDIRACMEAWTRDPKGEEGAASGLFGLQRTFEGVLKKEECSLGTGGGGREVQEASMSLG